MSSSGLWEKYYFRMYGVWPEPPRPSSDDVRRGALTDEVFARTQAMLEHDYEQWEQDNQVGQPVPQTSSQARPGGLTASGVPEFAEAEPR